MLSYANRLALAPWVSTNPAAEGGEAGAAAAAAAAAAGEPLPQRLAALLSGLLPGTWASWLRGDQVLSSFRRTAWQLQGYLQSC